MLLTMLAHDRCTVTCIGTTVGPKIGTQVPLLKIQAGCAVYYNKA